MSENSKRVRMTYTVEIEEVPSRIAELLREAEATSEALTRQIAEVASALDPTGDVNKAIVMLDNVRQDMMKTDLRLDDCHGLLVGYQSAIAEFNKMKLDGPPAAITEEAEDG